MAFIEASKTGSVIDTDAEHITYDNTESGLESENVQGAIDEVVDNISTINDNLSGFKFYPIGTNLVALVADDSFYTDSDGKYVLASSTTGQALITGDPTTYKSLASTEDTRGEVGADTATPFKGEFIAESAITRSNSRTINNLEIGRKYIVFTSTNAVNMGGIQSGGTLLYEYSYNEITFNHTVTRTRCFSFEATDTSVVLNFSWDQTSSTNRITCVPLTGD